MNIKNYRKQIVFTLDFLIIIMVYCGLFFLQSISEGRVRGSEFFYLLPHLALYIVCQAAFQLIYKTYESIWRYAGCREYLILFSGAVSGYSCYLLISLNILEYKIPVIFSMALCTCSLMLMLLMRFVYRVYRKYNGSMHLQGKNYLAIVGAGAAGVQLLEELQSNPNSNYKVYCFFDDSIEKIGKYIHNIEVKGPIKNMPQLLADKPVHEIIVAIPSASVEERRTILRVCSTMKCLVRILPNTMALFQNDSIELSKSIRNVKIEDLLGRDTIKFDNKEVNQFLSNKVIMITGGGGSIGSELCRQIAKEEPKQIILVDIYENNVYDIQQELLYTYNGQLDLKVEIATVRDADKINQLFSQYRPNIVFHAAAHKHVPLMEGCPDEAIKNNVFGTYNVVHAADKWGAEKFVLISTDKAVNPTNIMGASKRMCEMIIQSMKRISKTEFVAVRFGNVLGSNGSVVPLFQWQIEHGGPVTITDKRIIRYFMTIPEAAQLVLQAGAMANRSEIYVLDMGEPVKILDLAENLIRLSGYMPYTEIPIIETGLRPGEKLYEELLMSNEELVATSNHKIFIDREKEIYASVLNEKLQILQAALDTESITVIKKAMKLIIPTYRDAKEVNGQAILLDYSETVKANLKEVVAAHTG